MGNPDGTGKPQNATLSYTVAGRAKDPLQGGTLSYTMGRISAEEIAAAAFDVPAEWEKGDVLFDLYQVEEELGRGGFGTVYRVRHLIWNVPLAVKTLNPEVSLSRAGRDSFTAECEKWVNLGLHPHIVTCFYVRDLGGLPRIFSEFIAGGTLGDWHEKGKLKDWEQIMDCALQCLEGLSFAHRKGVIHLDIKPANCLMTEEGDLKLTDFGIALGMRALEDSTAQASSAAAATHAAGTPPYMPPEQWDPSRGDIGPWTDIYALGSMLFELCTGELLFVEGNDDPVDVIRERHLRAQPPDPRDIREDIPEPLARFMLRCLEKKADMRFSSAEKAAEALKEVYQSVTGERYLRPCTVHMQMLADGVNNRAISLIDLGKIDEALALFDEALNMEPHHPESTYNRTLISWRRGSITTQDMEKTLEEMRSSHESEWIDEYLTGLAYLEAGLVSKALPLLREAWQQGGRSDAEKAVKDAEKLASGAAASGRFNAPLMLSRVKSLVEIDRVRRRYEDLLERAQGAMAQNRFSDAQECLREARALPGCSRLPEGLALWHDLGSRGTRQGLRGAWLASVSVLAHGSHQAASVILNAEREIAAAAETKNLYLHDLSKGGEGTPISADRPDLFHNALALSGDGKRAVSAAGEMLMAWDMEKGTLECEKKIERKAPLTVALSGDGTTAFIGSAGGGISIWGISEEMKGHKDYDTYKSFYHDREGEKHEGKVFPVAAAMRNTIFATGDSGKSIRVWTVNRMTIPLVNEKGIWSYDILSTLEKAGGTCRLLCFSPDEKSILGSGSLGYLYLWDTLSGRIIAKRQCGSSTISALAWSADSRFLACGNEKGDVHLYAVEELKTLRVFPGNGRAIAALSFSQDGQRLLAADCWKRVQHWALDWDYSTHVQSLWDDGAEPAVRNFADLHHDKTSWDEKDCSDLLRYTRNAGFGWVSPEGLYQKLAQISRKPIHVDSTFAASVKQQRFERLKKGDYRIEITGMAYVMILLILFIASIGIIRTAEAQKVLMLQAPVKPAVLGDNPLYLCAGPTARFDRIIGPLSLMGLWNYDKYGKEKPSVMFRPSGKKKIIPLGIVDIGGQSPQALNDSKVLYKIKYDEDKNNHQSPYLKPMVGLTITLAPAMVPGSEGTLIVRIPLITIARATVEKSHRRHRNLYYPVNQYELGSRHVTAQTIIPVRFIDRNEYFRVQKEYKEAKMRYRDRKMIAARAQNTASFCLFFAGVLLFILLAGILMRKHFVRVERNI